MRPQLLRRITPLLLLAALFPRLGFARNEHHGKIAPAVRKIRPLGSNGPLGYSPSQVSQAYGFDKVTSLGGGQTIGIIVAYGNPNVKSDLNTFSTRFGLPTTSRFSFKIIYPQGQPSRSDYLWAAETSLDVQWAHAMAPKARILLVVAKSESIHDLLGAVKAAVSQGAKQISMSWGAPEFSFQSDFDGSFDFPGVTSFAASGDTGTGVLWPAVSSYVVGVGGTSLQMDANGNVLSETAWSGSGGGESQFALAPEYQTAVQYAAGRGVPDVSYNADPSNGYAIYHSLGCSSDCWFEVGGTSAGAPQWAALMARVNAKRSRSLRNAHEALYHLGRISNQLLYFRDIADPGYDFVTGLGTPRVDKLVPELISY